MSQQINSHKKITVSPSEEGLSLLQCVTRSCPVYSGKALKRMIDRGYCRVNGEVERFSSRKVRTGDQLRFRQYQSADALPVICFEDDALIVYDKPPGCSVETIVQGCSYHLVHRIDKPTSGLVMVAKNVSMKSAMEDIFRKREITKEYLAWVDGISDKKEGVVSASIQVLGHRGQQKYMGIAKKKQGKKAETYWKVIEEKEGYCLMRLLPITGRTHQLRVHMTYIGHPILGDYQYVRSFPSGIYPERLLLHAYSLSFIHPFSGEPMFFQQKPSEDFYAYSHREIVLSR